MKYYREIYIERMEKSKPRQQGKFLRFISSKKEKNKILSLDYLIESYICHRYIT